MELLAKTVRRKKRPNFSPEFKKQLAQHASEPGVSVSLLAQENDINVNMLFKWRRQWREGRFDGVAHRPAMLPVTIVDESCDHLPLADSTSTGMPVVVSAEKTVAIAPGVIEIQIAGGTLRFDDKANLVTVGAVIGMLRP